MSEREPAPNEASEEQINSPITGSYELVEGVDFLSKSRWKSPTEIAAEQAERQSKLKQAYKKIQEMGPNELNILELL